MQAAEAMIAAAGTSQESTQLQDPLAAAKAALKRPASAMDASLPVHRGNLSLSVKLAQMLAAEPPSAKRRKCTVCFFGSVDTKMVPCGTSVLCLQFSGPVTIAFRLCLRPQRPRFPRSLFATVGPFVRSLPDMQSKNSGLHPSLSSDAHSAFSACDQTRLEQPRGLPAEVTRTTQVRVSESAAGAPAKSTLLIPHRGKWTPAEEKYALKLIEYFNNGQLPLLEGTTLRAFLSKLLDCDPMRISKKFQGNQALGKVVPLLYLWDAHLFAVSLADLLALGVEGIQASGPD